MQPQTRSLWSPSSQRKFHFIQAAGGCASCGSAQTSLACKLQSLWLNLIPCMNDALLWLLVYSLGIALAQIGKPGTTLDSSLTLNPSTDPHNRTKRGICRKHSPDTACLSRVCRGCRLVLSLALSPTSDFADPLPWKPLSCYHYESRGMNKLSPLIFVVS